MILKGFGQLIKRKRQAINMSGEELAEHVTTEKGNKANRHWLFWLENRDRDVRVSQFLQLAEGLHICPVDLLEEYLDEETNTV